MKDKKEIKTAVDSLLDMFTTGKMPEAVAFHLIRKQQGVEDKPSDKWSIGNKILQSIQGTDDSRGFKQWNTVGRAVKKGSKAIYIVAPLTRKIKEINSKTGKEEDKLVIKSFRAIPVYRVEDTEGDPLPQPVEYLPAEYPPLFDVAEKLGISVSYSPCGGLYLGTYTISNNSIKLCSHDAIVYFHELAHAVHNTFSDLRKCPSDVAECVAEFSACVLCQIQGIEGYESQGWDYIKTISRHKDEPDKALRLIMQVLADVEKVVLTILNVATKEKDPEEAVSQTA